MPDSVEATIVQNLVAGAAKYVGGEAMSWIVSEILGTGGGDDVAADLQTIQNDLSNLSTEVSDIEATVQSFQKDYNAQTAYDNLMNVLTSGSYPLTTIHADFGDMTGLSATDTASAKAYADAGRALGYSDELYAMIAVMTGTSESAPGDLMGAAAATLIAKWGSSWDTTDGAALLASYQALEDHCHGMFSLQVKALFLTTNCYNAVSESDEAQKRVSAFTTSLPVQCEFFLSAVETLAASYHFDESLIDMTIGDSTQDIIRLAHLFINEYLTDAAVAPATSRFYVWHGSGPSFNVAGPEPGASVIAIPGLDPTAVVRTTFANGSNTWYLSRFEYTGVAAKNYSGVAPANANVSAILDGTSQNKFLAIPLTCGYLIGSTNGSFAVFFCQTTLQTNGGYALLPASGSTATVMFWVYVTGPGAIASSYTVTPTNAKGRSDDVVGWTLSVDSTGMHVTLEGFSIKGTTDTSQMTTNGTKSIFGTWIPFVITVSGSTLGLSINGEPIHTFDLGFSVALGGGICIGADVAGASQISPCLATFNAVRFWDSVLSDSDFQSYLGSGTANGAVSFWGLDRGTLANSVSGGAAGTQSGTVALISPQPPMQVGGLIVTSNV